jgi:hypothetical protein
MRRSARFLALSFAVAAAAAVAPMSAGAVQIRPSTLFTLTMSGIDRDGTPLAVSASVNGLNGVSYLSGGATVAVPAGTYIVAAPIWRPADGSTQTLVARKVHVTGNVHVTLNAQGAVPVDASLNAAGTQGPQTVELCVHGGGEVNPVTGFLVESPGTVYLKPMTAGPVRTVYQTYWQGAGVLYDVAGAFSGGIPANPVYHAHVSSMAKVDVQMRPFENVTPLRAVLESYDGCGSSTEPVTTLPQNYTDFRTAGNWNTNQDFGPSPANVQRDIFKTSNYLAGHSYTDSFGSAAAGPAADFPEIDGSDIVYSPIRLFADPVVRPGFDCEGKAGLRLTRSSVLVAKANLEFCGQVNEFSAHVKKKTWYTLTADARRRNPSGSLPPVLLSSRVLMTWRFRFAPVTGHPINAQALPVTVTRFVPQHLGFGNDALTKSTTTVLCYVLRGGGQPVPTPRYRLRTVRFSVSFNNGVTWHVLTAIPHNGFWTIHVGNPATSGYVSLRSVVTDSHGDSTTETIYRAYLVEHLAVDRAGPTAGG